MRIQLRSQSSKSKYHLRMLLLPACHMLADGVGKLLSCEIFAVECDKIAFRIYQVHDD